MILASTGAAQGVFQLLVVLIIFVVVLILTYYTTKWIAGYQKKRGSGANVEIIETSKIGNDRYIEIVRVGKDRYFVLALGKNEVTSLGEMAGDELIEVKREASGLAAHGFSSGSRFDSILKGLKKTDAAEEEGRKPFPAEKNE